eukprot:gene9305-6544_t
MGKGKKKVLFNPYARLCKYTCSDESYKNTKPVYSHLADFTDTGITISPAIPKSEVGLSIQFRCTVHIVEGDIVTIHLPGFKGPSKVFSLEMRPHPDGLNMAHCFQGFWSGDEKLKGRGKNGLPNKQQLILKCIRRVEENTLVLVGVPLSASIISPDKLPLNSGKIKIDGRIRNTDGGRIAKQPFLSCSEIKKKMTIAEEMEIYTQHINGLVESVGLSKEMRFVGEELYDEEIDQMWEAVQSRRPFTTDMAFTIAVDTFRSYEASGGFIKCIMENTIRFVKERDPLALHKEVARNWGVKVGAVVILEDALSTKYAGFYPKLTRVALLASHLLLMTPADVAHVFPGLDTPPKFSIYHELISAYRMRSLIGVNDASGTQNRSETILSKWQAFIAVLMIATTSVDDAEKRQGGDDDADQSKDSGDGGQRAVTVTFAQTESDSLAQQQQQVYMLNPPPLYVGFKELPPSEQNYLKELQPGEWYMFPSFIVAREDYPPLQDLAARAAAAEAAAAAAAAAAANLHQNKKKGRKGSKGKGAKETAQFQAGAGIMAAAAAAAAAAAGAGAGEGPAADGGEGRPQSAEEEHNWTVPDNAVVFEIRRTVECLEMADLAACPSNKEWLLPLSASFRVVSVRVLEELNDLIHIVLDMKGSLGGAVLDEYIPDSDRSIANMVTRKVLQEAEKAEVTVPAIALLTYYNVKLARLRCFHPPTLMREQYLRHFREAKLQSEAKQSIESGAVVWQICAAPAQQIEDGIIKQAVWEAMNRKVALTVEYLFRMRSRSQLEYLDQPGGLTSLSFSTYMADYMGKGPRSIRRLVRKGISHEAPKPTLQQLMAEIEVGNKQLKQLTAKLGQDKAKKEHYRRTSLMGDEAPSPARVRVCREFYVCFTLSDVLCISLVLVCLFVCFRLVFSSFSSYGVLCCGGRGEAHERKETNIKQYKTKKNTFGWSFLNGAPKGQYPSPGSSPFSRICVVHSCRRSESISLVSVYEKYFFNKEKQTRQKKSLILKTAIELSIDSWWWW